MGMVAGAPFPELYDWTWGEIVEFVVCYNERHKQELRDQASMDFTTAHLVASFLTAGKGQSFSVLDSYSFLWTDEERQNIKKEELKRKMEAKTRQKKSTTEEEGEEPSS